MQANFPVSPQMHAPHPNRGFTLIEVMIGMALALLSMLIILQLFSVSDARKRMTTGAAEAQQTANVSIYDLGRYIRLAGAGLTQASNLWGCPVQAFRSGTQILPAPAPFAGTFANASQTIRAIPLLILPAAAPDGRSDIIVVIAANSETGQAELQMAGPPKAAGLTLLRSNGIKARDLILMTSPGAISNCQIAQVDTSYSSTAPNTLPLGATGTYYNTTTGLATGAYNSGSVPLHLGATPMFMMYGINSANSLEQYDLLNLGGTTTSVIADNVFDMRARYGVVDATGNGPITWVAPTTTGWTTTDLTAGSTAALNLIDRIRAIRISMVFRSTEPVKDTSPPTSYVMFPEASPITVSIPAAMQLYRYQVYDTVIPLRNMRYAANVTAPFLPYAR